MTSSGEGHISKRIKELEEAVVGNIVCSWESVHTFSHLSINRSIGDLGFEVVEVNDGWRQQINGDREVFIICEVTSQLNVFQNQCNKVSVGSANNIVE